MHTRIPSGQATGNFDILLPTGFGIPKGFIVYNLTNSSAYNAFDNGTANVTRSVGFGGSTSTGSSALRNICSWQYNQYNVDPTNGLSSFATTVAMYDRNSGNTITRIWYATSFVTDKIIGQYQVVGSPTGSVDMVFTVFSGDDVQCAVSGVAVTTTAIHNAATPFQADLVYLLHNRPGQTTDVEICYGAGHRTSGAGTADTTVRISVSSSHRNPNGQTTSAPTNRVSSPGTFIMTTNYAIYPTYMGTTSIGFTGSGAAVGNSVVCLAIKGPTSDDFAVGTFLTPASIGSSLYNTNFVPQIIVGGFCGVPAINTTYTTAGNNCETMSVFTANGFSRSNMNGLGTITTSTANATVTGTGSSFLFQIGPTDIIKTTDGREVGTVSSVASNTSLTLTANSALTLTAQNFVFEKSPQFSLSWGIQDADSGTPNQFMYGYSSTSALIGYSCQNTPVIVHRGTIADLREGNVWSANMTVTAGGADVGWYSAIKNQDVSNRRRAVGSW